MKLLILTQTLICRSPAAAEQLWCMFPHAVPPETSGSLGKGLTPLPQRICLAATGRGNPFSALLLASGLSSPASRLSHLLQPSPLLAPVPEGGPSPPDVRTVAAGICPVCSSTTWPASLRGLPVSLVLLYNPAAIPCMAPTAPRA